MLPASWCNSGGSRFLQNVGMYLPLYTASHRGKKKPLTESHPPPKPDESSPQPPIIFL